MAAKCTPGKARPSETRGLLSIRGYSQHRRALGLPYAASTIHRALADGRIHRTCPDHERCPEACRQGGIDPEVADREWALSARRGPLAGEGPGDALPGSVSAARLEREMVMTKLAKLKLAREAGRLVDRVKVESRARELSGRARDLVLTVPRRVSGRVAGMTDKRRIEELLYQELEAALRGLRRERERKR